MEKYVQVHYENFKSSSELSHNMRTQKEPKHLLKLEDRLPNVLDLESRKKFDKLLKEAKQKNKRSFQKTAKPNIDAVVSFSDYQVKANIEKYGIEKYNEMIMSRIENVGKEIEEKYGIKFVSVNLHNDEGHYENNEIVYNQHCHINFLDFDFNKNQRVLRTMKKKDFSDWQDIVFNHFQDLGYERGISKSEKKHIQDFGEAKERLNNEIEELENEIENMSIKELQDLKIKYKNDKLKKRLVDYVYRFKVAEKLHTDNGKNLKRIIDTWEKIQNDNVITKEEQKEFTKMLNAVGAKGKAKSVSKMKVSSSTK
jgi:hypothetical protein